MNHNYLNATIVNTFLASLNNPEVSVLTPAEVFADINANKETDDAVVESIKQLGFVWSEAYVQNILDRNRRTQPFTMEDIQNADAVDMDILMYKACSCEQINKAELQISDLTGLNISIAKQDADLYFEKAKKGTPEYAEWLRKYHEKKGIKPEDNSASRRSQNTLKARKALAGISSATLDDVKAAVDSVPDSGSKPVRIAGVKAAIFTDDESTMIQVYSDYTGATATAAYIGKPKSQLTRKDLGDVAVAINKIINGQPQYYLPKSGSANMD